MTQQSPLMMLSCWVSCALLQCCMHMQAGGQAQHQRLTAMLYAVQMDAGSESMFTVQENRDAFARIKLLPRMLRDVSKVDMSCNILGTLTP